MEVQEAVKLAKKYVEEVFRDEDPTNIGLEEIEFDDTDSSWNVTIGFSRPWNSVKTSLAAITGEAPRKRAYKIVRIRDDDGRMIAIKRREVVE